MCPLHCSRCCTVGEAFQSVHPRCLFIYLSVSQLWKTELHQALCYHKQCFDKYLFICTCLAVYFGKIFPRFGSWRQITDSLPTCISHFSSTFQNAFISTFPAPAGRLVLMVCCSLMFAFFFFVLVECILIRWQCDMVQFNRCELFVDLVLQMSFFQVVICLLTLSVVPLD